MAKTKGEPGVLGACFATLSSVVRSDELLEKVTFK